MKLNLGCGTDVQQGYTNVDLRAMPGIDHIRDVSDLSWIPSNTVEEIVGKDIVEHFSWRRTEEILREWHRVLAPNGKMILTLPDMKRLCERYLGINCDNAEQHKIDNALMTMLLYGGQDYAGNYHMAGWDAESFIILLKKVEFVNISVTNNGGTNLIVICHKKA